MLGRNLIKNNMKVLITIKILIFRDVWNWLEILIFWPNKNIKKSGQDFIALDIHFF